MKVRFGVSLGTAARSSGAGAAPGAGSATGSDRTAGFAREVDRLEEAGVDSLWLSELVYSDLMEPYVGMAYALSRTRKLKVGTGVTVLPGRHPALVAKQLTSLAELAPGRVLPVFGLKPAQRQETSVFPLLPKRDGTGAPRRGELFDESLELLNRLLAGERVTYEGQCLRVTDAWVGPRPRQPLDIWLGGSAPAGLRRVGRLADGWLGSFLSPQEAGAARRAIEQAASEAGRSIDPDHFGISLPVALGDVPERLLALLRERRSDTDPAELMPAGWAACRALVDRYVDEGISKFVVRCASPDTPFEEFLDGFTSTLLPLQT